MGDEADYIIDQIIDWHTECGGIGDFGDEHPSFGRRRRRVTDYRNSKEYKTRQVQPPAGVDLQKPDFFKTRKMRNGDNTMNTGDMITIMQLEGGAKIVRAEYLDGNNGKPYHFKNVIGLGLEAGDLIVAETRDTFALLVVTDPNVILTHVSGNLSNLKHVVAKVRNDDYLAVTAREAEATRKLALSEVTSRLDTYRKQVGDGAFGAVAGLLGLSDKDDDGEVIE